MLLKVKPNSNESQIEKIPSELFSKEDYEVLVVDNSSDNETKKN